MRIRIARIEPGVAGSERFRTIKAGHKDARVGSHHLVAATDISGRSNTNPVGS
jgi:hypothetical protein